MAKKSTSKSVKKQPATKSTTQRKGKRPSSASRVVLILLTLLGIGIMIYLTKLHYADSGKSVCDINATFSCGAVNTSEYSELFGIPVSMLGIGFFSLILGLSVFKYSRDTLKTITFLSLAFMGPSLYLTSLEIFVIDSICLFCEMSKVLVILIIVTALVTLKPLKDAKNLVSSGIFLGVLLAFFTFGAFRLASEKVEEGKYNEFAQQLTEQGWIMYGSETCQFCGRQRAAFGEEAFSYINEIECDPRNENDQAELCVEKEIDHTPTWVLEDEDGNTIRKLESGMIDLEVLAEEAGLTLPE